MALRNMSVDINFNTDLSEINRLDSTIDDVIRNVTGGIGRAEGSVNDLGDEFGDLANDATRDMSRVGDAISDIGSEANSSIRDIDRVDSSIRDVANSGNQLSGLRTDFNRVGSGANDASNEVRELGDDIRSELGSSASGTVEELSKGFDGLSGALASLGVGLGVGEIISSTNEISKAMNGLQAQTGLTDEEMKLFNDEMLDLYNNNYGESIEDLAMKMGKVKQITGEVDPTKIKELTKNAIALEDTFGSDFNETVRGVSNMMRHFGLDSEEAFDLFAKGSQLGLDYTDELGDNVAEYGGNFAQAGYSADEYFQLLKNGAQGGAYNLDKVNDSINEVKNRLGDGTIEKNIGMFSQGTQDLFKKWQNGEATMKDVINSIVGDINNCENEQEGLTMAATAFGTMGEDANLNVVKSLNTLGDDFKNTKGTAEDLNKVKYDDAMSSISGLGRTIQTDIAEKSTPIVEGLGKAAQFVADNWDKLGPIFTGVAVFLGALAIAWGVYTVAQWAANISMYASPLGWVVAAIAAIIAIIVVLIMYWDEIAKACTDAWNWVMGVLSQIGQWIWDNVINPVIQFFVNLWNKIVEIWNSIVSSIQTIFGVIANWVNDNVIQPLVNFFTGLWNKITEIFGKVASWFSEKFQAAYDGIKNIFSNIGSFFSGIWENIKKIFTNIGQSIADGVSGAFKSTVNAVIGFAENTINGFIKGVNAAIDLINAIPGVNISKLNLLSIPRLATGGVVDSPTTAVIGEAGRKNLRSIEEIQCKKYSVNSWKPKFRKVA